MITLESALFWLVVTAAVCLMSFLAEKSNKIIFVILLWLLVSFVAGFRSFNVGLDTLGYSVAISKPSSFGKEFEVLFAIINKVLYGLTHSISFVFFFYALLMYGLVLFRLWEMRDAISFSVAFISYYALCYYQSLNVMRQYIAISVIFYSIRYLSKGKYVKFVLCVLVAFTFHKSALLGLLCFGSEFLCWRDIDKKKRIFLSVMMLAGVAAIPFAISAMNQYAHYFEKISENVGYKVLEFSFIFIISLFYLHRYARRKPLVDRNEHYLLRSTQIYYIMATGLWTIGYYFPFMDRIGWYFLPFICVYFGLMMKEKKIFGLSSLVLRTVIVVFIVYMLFNYTFLYNGPGHHPYHFVWST